MTDSTLNYVGALPHQTSDPATVETTYRKITLRLMSFLFFCWVLNYLDRVNISFAQLHLKHDLGLSDAAYGLGVSLFFIGYILLEVPSTLLLRRIGARKTITRIMLLWGGISTAMAFMNAPWQFYLARTLLGAAEAGFWPGIILYLSFWYPAKLRARITSRFLLAIAVAGIIGGPLSGLILENFHEVWGFRNWQWLLFLEGLPAVVAGIVAWFYLTDKPQDAKWLTNQEKLIVLNALEEENRQKPENAPSSLMAALRDPRVYVIAAGWATVPICGTILNYWTPTIIKQTGVSNMLHIGFLSALPYLVGAVAMLFIARSSDLRLERRWHFALSTTAGAIGALMLTLFTESPVAAIVCLSLVSVSYFAAAAIVWTIPPNYLTGEAAAGGIGVISSLGQVGAFFAPIVLGWVKSATGSFSAGILLVAALVFIGGLAVFFGVPRQQASQTGA
ncbi:MULTISPECIES: MFS transporter [Comamonas]|jgi:ACS family phthalate transporter-like MFS transporter|uniref:Major facilitator transporter n=1 Tax=Comamonas thiooxydans TaxID=363952 RepID=A0A454Y6L7_9BURK|nr:MULTISPECIES: MFS transporter [Comamonas]GGH63233.1 MFS transporter [Comamonas phosphati]ACY32230.1 major facilitator superfamily MFS_1 [Comamonas thiooxydans]KGG89963.1 major facilitator transporter [Comamonas thiooxydans]KGG97466.1 major facilitator transporter [Comamonas thiooxydans]KGH09915.1 major facilitator transporter [Comamonas thiooxydans]